MLIATAKRLFAPAGQERLPAALVHALWWCLDQRAEWWLGRTPVFELGSLEAALGLEADPDEAAAWVQSFVLGRHAVLDLLTRPRALRALEREDPLVAAIIGPRARAFELGLLDGLEALRLAERLCSPMPHDERATAARALGSALWRVYVEDVDGEKGAPNKKRARRRKREAALRKAFIERAWLEPGKVQRHDALRCRLKLEKLESWPEEPSWVWVVDDPLRDRDEVHERLVARLREQVPCVSDQTVWIHAGAEVTENANARLPESRISPRSAKIDDTTALQLLYRYFGFTSFRDGQDRLLQRAFARENTLGVLPTGAGKSICFMLPALIGPGLTLVVTPLVALGRDHLLNLERMGFGCGERLDASVTRDRDRHEALWRRLESGEVKLLFVTPERFLNHWFRERLRRLREFFPIQLAVIDEAHCVSEWGHDFRPAYLVLREHFRELAPEAAMLALTATASERVQRDVLELLEFADDAVVQPNTLDRVELSFAVALVFDRTARKPAPLSWSSTASGVLARLDEIERYTGGPIRRARPPEEARQAVIYCPLTGARGRKPKSPDDVLNKVTPLARALNEELRVALAGTGKDDAAAKRALSDRKPIAYHGQLPTGDQERRHLEFKNQKQAVLVATKAFGMGIDVPTIRGVLHCGLPSSLEQYYQEAGRGGRDGKRAHCVIHYVPRPASCMENAPAGVRLPPCAEDPFFRGCAFTRELNGFELCSYGLQIHLLCQRRGGPLIDLYRLASFARRSIGDGAPEVEVPLKPGSGREPAWEAPPGTWLVQKRNNLRERFPEIAACLDEISKTLETEPLEVRWLKLNTWKWKKGHGADDAFELTDLEATRFLVALKRLGLVERFSPCYRVDDAGARPVRTTSKAPPLESFRVRWATPWPLLTAGAIAAKVAGLGEGAHAALYTPLIETLARGIKEAHDLETRRDVLLHVAALHTATQYAEFFVSRLEMLRHVEAYAMAEHCRKRALLGYFGSSYPYDGPCRRCDRCTISHEDPTWLPDLAPALELLRSFGRSVTARRWGTEALSDLPALESACAKLAEEGEAVAAEAMLSRELEERPGNVSARFARALLAARGDLDRHAGLREQNRHDFDEVLAACLDLATSLPDERIVREALRPIVRVLTHRVEHHGWRAHGLWAKLTETLRRWPLATRDALIDALHQRANGDGPSGLEALSQALWLETFDQELAEPSTNHDQGRP